MGETDRPGDRHSLRSLFLILFPQISLPAISHVLNQTGRLLVY